MTRRDFTDRALLPLTRLTWEEREAVRQELEEHVEDRMEILLEMGWAEELAEARCLEAMGDPAEIGRELAKQYRSRDRGWVWLGRAAVALTAVLCVQALPSLGALSSAWDSLTVRSIRVPAWWGFELDTVEAQGPADIRVRVGNDVLRVACVSVGREDRGGGRSAGVLLLSYDRIPGGVVASSVLDSTVLENQRGGRAPDRDAAWGHVRVRGAVKYVDVEPGDAYVTLVHEWLGETIRVQVPLPGEEEP